MGSRRVRTAVTVANERTRPQRGTPHNEMRSNNWRWAPKGEREGTAPHEARTQERNGRDPRGVAPWARPQGAEMEGVGSNRKIQAASSDLTIRQRTPRREQ